MSDSDELFENAVDKFANATHCQTWEAKLAIRSVSAYIARFNAEISSREGPAHEWAKANGI